MSARNPGHPLGVRLAGTGIALPQRVMTNDDLAKLVDTNDAWISQRTGIKTRRVAAKGQTSRRLAADALKMALVNAGLEPKQLDMVIVATITPEMVCPCTAAQVVADVGAIPAAAMDLNAACSGFVYALTLATGLIKSRMYRTIAVLGAETLSAITDWKDRRTCILFGDGAGAAILTASDDPQQGCLYQSLHSDGTLWPELYIPRDQSNIPATDKVFSGAFNTLQMNGAAIFKFAVTTLNKALQQALDTTGVQPADLAMVVPHQMNLRIIESARERLGLPPEKMYVNIANYGNTSAASIPICLHELVSSGRLKKGDLVLFVGLGGGLTWATNLWRL